MFLKFNYSKIIKQSSIYALLYYFIAYATVFDYIELPIGSGYRALRLLLHKASRSFDFAKVCVVVSRPWEYPFNVTHVPHSLYLSSIICDLTFGKDGLTVRISFLKHFTVSYLPGPGPILLSRPFSYS